MKLITYGDSFTRYRWWTWADILAQNLDLPLVNRGRPACANNFIFHRLNRDLRNGLIEKNDVVHIMWCHYNRVSRIIDDDEMQYQKETTNILEQKKNFYATIDIIKKTETLLRDHNYEFMTWLPLHKNGVDDSQNASILQSTKNKFIESYDTTSLFMTKFKPPFVEKVYNGRITSRTDFAISMNDIPSVIQKNLSKQASKKNQSVIDFIRNNAQDQDARTMIFFDFHPTPLHHLEYLQSIYPQANWSDNLITKIQQENKNVLSKIWSEIPREWTK